ncbi:MAG: response regulator transcription factor, partial [Cyanobacteria bacterium]|nr:response regulator transcription factor [Cyanobacteriota bacterium]
MENAENISLEKTTPGCFKQNPPLNLLLVDDHHILRQGMKQLLEMEDGIHICGESDNGEDAILKALSLKPDIILMDINLPKANGYAASK